MRPFATTGEFAVAAVKKVRYDDIFFHEGGDRWYKVKVNFITIDEKTAAEKRVASNSLVQASSLKEALDTFMKGMEGTTFDYEVAAITETPLMDVFTANLTETLADKAARKAK